MLVLDLTSDGILDGELLARLDSLAERNRDVFNRMIGELTRGRERDIDWWASWPASRDTHASTLFARCAQLALVRELMDSGTPFSVLVDDAALARVLSASGVTIKRAGIASRRLKRLLRALWNIGSSLFNVLGSVTAAAWTGGRKRSLPRGAVLIEEYVGRGAIRNGTFSDHYFPGIGAALPEGTTFSIVPIFYRVRNYFALIGAMRSSPVHFLLREDHLSIGDYVFAYLHWWRARRLFGRSATFAGFDVGELVDADLAEGYFTNASIQALLSFRFWSRIDEIAGGAARVLDWYEGQTLDHATAAAFNWHPVSVQQIGYRPIAPRQYLSVTPTQYEIEAGVVPRVLAVVGTGIRSELARDLTNVDIRPAPSFRHRHIAAQPVAKTDSSSPTVVVLLPLDAPRTRLMGRMLSSQIAAAEFSHVRWLIKRHPLMPLVEAANDFGQLAGRVNFVDGDLYAYFAGCDLVIGTATNALAEALAAGLPVLCLALGNAPTEIPMPEWAPASHANVCYDDVGLQQQIRRYLSAKPPSFDVVNFREAWAGPLDPLAIRKSLGL